MWKLVSEESEEGQKAAMKPNSVSSPKQAAKKVLSIPNHHRMGPWALESYK